MPFQIIRNDITKMKTDVIVNSANPNPIFKSGADLQIYEAAQDEKILEERRVIGKIARGDAQYTSAGKLHAKYIIHTVGPRWEDENSKETLRNCYKNSLALAKKLNCESISFPLISSGAYHFPKEVALEIATDEFRKFLLDNEMMIYLVVFDDESFEISSKIYTGIYNYISENIVSKVIERMPWLGTSTSPNNGKPFPDLQTLLQSVTETWQEKLIDLIQKSGKKEVAIYTDANLSKQTFAKIKNIKERKENEENKIYVPKKETVLALAIGLELNEKDAESFLADAGYAFSNTNPTDVIVRYFISTKEYDIDKINEVLFANKLPTLGTKLRDDYE